MTAARARLRIAARAAAIASAVLVLGACRRETPPPSPATASAAQPVATTGASAGAAASSTATSTDMDASALKALDKMGAYMRTLKAFQVTSQTTREEVLGDGQKVQFGGTVDLLLQRPNRLRADVTSDRQQRLYLYDGTSFTLWARRLNYYATVPAPASLVELADRLQDRYGLELPLADLFYWGTDARRAGEIKAAMDVGPSQVEGVTCEHFAFRQADVDWQVWIQQGDNALPRKLVITTLTDEARPQFTSVMTWNLAPSYNDAAFAFVPSSDAKKIVFAELGRGTSDR